MDLFSAAPVLVLGNMGSEITIQESRESLDLGSLGLPGEAVVTLELESEPKQCSSNKASGNTESSQSAKIVVSGELKDKLQAQAGGKDLPEDQFQLTTSSVPCSLSAGTADISSPVVGFSALSRTRAKKRHDCTFDGCGFSTCYLKDLVRHMRRHTGTTRLSLSRTVWLVRICDDCIMLDMPHFLYNS
jgi:hypothetical protein